MSYFARLVANLFQKQNHQTDHSYPHWNSFRPFQIKYLNIPMLAYAIQKYQNTNYLVAGCDETLTDCLVYSVNIENYRI